MKTKGVGAYAPTPFVFTAAGTERYLILAHSYLNDVGGYELEAKVDDVRVPIARRYAIPTPSGTPMTFFEPASPTEEWEHSATGDLAIEKPTETWSFQGLEGQNLKIDLGMIGPYPKDRDDLTESYLYLFDVDGQLIASDDDSGAGEDSRIYFTLPSDCLLYTSPSPRDATLSRMPSSA